MVLQARALILMGHAIDWGTAEAVGARSLTMNSWSGVPAPTKRDYGQPGDTGADAHNRPGCRGDLGGRLEGHEANISVDDDPPTRPPRHRFVTLAMELDAPPSVPRRMPPATSVQHSEDAAPATHRSAKVPPAGLRARAPPMREGQRAVRSLPTSSDLPSAYRGKRGTPSALLTQR
jgi:hypothetical protein